MTKGSKKGKQKTESLSLREEKDAREMFMEHLANVINIDREVLYIKYAKMLFDKTSQIFNVNIVPSVSLETNKAEAPETMMRILSENRIMDNIVYEIFSSVLIPPEEFYLRNLKYIDDHDDDGVNHKKVMIKFDEALMDYDYADYVTKHNKNAVSHIKELDEVHRFQEAEKHPEQAKQSKEEEERKTLENQKMFISIKERLDKINENLMHPQNTSDSKSEIPKELIDLFLNPKQNPSIEDQNKHISDIFNIIHSDEFKKKFNL